MRKGCSSCRFYCRSTIAAAFFPGARGARGGGGWGEELPSEAGSRLLEGMMPLHQLNPSPFSDPMEAAEECRKGSPRKYPSHSYNAGMWLPFALVLRKSRVRVLGIQLPAILENQQETPSDRASQVNCFEVSCQVAAPSEGSQRCSPVLSSDPMGGGAIAREAGHVTRSRGA